jgi:hypothetical protein
LGRPSRTLSGCGSTSTGSSPRINARWPRCSIFDNGDDHAEQFSFYPFGTCGIRRPEQPCELGNRGRWVQCLLRPRCSMPNQLPTRARRQRSGRRLLGLQMRRLLRSWSEQTWLPTLRCGLRNVHGQRQHVAICKAQKLCVDRVVTQLRPCVHKKKLMKRTVNATIPSHKWKVEQSSSQDR